MKKLINKSIKKAIKKTMILMNFIFIFNLANAEQLNFGGDFKGNINYAEKMGGFATEARELEIVANRIVQKDAEIKYYNLMLDKVNMKLQSAMKSTEEGEIETALDDLKTASTDLAVFNKNYVSNYRLIGNYQQQMENLLQGDDMFGNGGHQQEVITENKNMLIDMTRTLDKMGKTLKKDSEEYYRYIRNRDEKSQKKAEEKKDEMRNNLRSQVKNFTGDLGKFYENSAMLSKLILEEIQADNIVRLMILKAKRERIVGRLDNMKVISKINGRKGYEKDIEKYEKYKKVLEDMSKSGR